MTSHLNYLLLDKDDTLGSFSHPGLFPNVQEFLAHQHKLDTKLVITTYAPQIGAKKHLQPLDHLIHRYLCLENFRSQDKHGTTIKDFYIDSNGNVIENPTTPAIYYENPYAPTFAFKDLHLARRYLDPKQYNTLRTIMIGDTKDEYAAISDPFTPVIIISDRQRDGDWQPVTHLLNHLYQSPTQAPWEIFDELYDQMQQNAFLEQEFSSTFDKDRYLGRTITMHP